MTSIALAIPHTPWVPERVESMTRLRKHLGVGQDGLCLTSAYREFTDRAPNAVWSEHLWSWGIKTGAEWLLQLQDDARVAPNFWPALRAMLESLPADADVVCLEVAHRAAKVLAEDGARWMTTADMLIGVGYVIRTRALAEFLEWRKTQLKPGALEKGGLTEDTMLGVWCMVTGRRIWSPLPTIIDHDISLASTYGNDAHENRRPLVRWDTDNWPGKTAVEPEPGVQLALESVEWWQAEQPRHVGRFYEAMPPLAARWVEGVTSADTARWRRDDGSPVLMGVKFRSLARNYREPKWRLFVATPYRADGVQPDHMASVLALQRMLGIHIEHEMSMGTRHEHDDLVRVRSRMFQLAVESDCTHMLLTDADNAFGPETVIGMLQSGKDFVQCPYLRRDGKGYTIRLADEDRAKGHIPTERIHPDNTVEIEHTGLGLTLLSRACMEKMLAHYRRLEEEVLDLNHALGVARGRSGAGTSKEKSAVIEQLVEEIRRWRAGHLGLAATEIVDGRPLPLLHLFNLMNRDGVLCSEDVSLAKRWLDIGGKVWMYIGPGTPIAHYGSMKYQGKIEDLGFTRSEQ